MPDILPSAFDRADGLNGRLGTPDDPFAIENTSGGVFFEEMPDSPQVEFGDKATWTHRFGVDWEGAQLILEGWPRGSQLEDSSGIVTRVLSSNINYRKGNIAEVSVTAESVIYTPPAEYDVEEVELNPELEKHPRYKDLRAASNSAQILEIIKAALQSAQMASGQEYEQALFNTLVSPDPNVTAEALEIYWLKRKGQESFILPGFKVSYSTYHSISPLLNPGGYIEDPVVQGIIPYFFWSDDNTPSGNNTLLYLAQNVNPNLYRDGLSWLRQSDHCHEERSWFRLTQSWLGFPFGHWAEQLYDPLADAPIDYYLRGEYDA